MSAQVGDEVQWDAETPEVEILSAVVVFYGVARTPGERSKRLSTQPITVEAADWDEWALGAIERAEASAVIGTEPPNE